MIRLRPRRTAGLLASAAVITAALACGLLVLAPAVGAQAATGCGSGFAFIYVYSHDTGTQYDLTGHGNEQDVTVDANAGDCFVDSSNPDLWQPLQDWSAPSANGEGLCLGYNQDLGLVQEQTCNYSVSWQAWYPEPGSGYDGGTIYINEYAYQAGEPCYLAAGGLVGGDGVTLSSDSDSVLTSWYAAQKS
jgi:hypothetical protein